MINEQIKNAETVRIIKKRASITFIHFCLRSFFLIILTLLFKNINAPPNNPPIEPMITAATRESR